MTTQLIPFQYGEQAVRVVTDAQGEPSDVSVCVDGCLQHFTLGLGEGDGCGAHGLFLWCGWYKH